MGELGFKASEADPCSLIKGNEKGIIFVALYVDDCLCECSKQLIDELKMKIQEKGLTIIDDDVKDYLSCEIHFLKDKKSSATSKRYFGKY